MAGDVKFAVVNDVSPAGAGTQDFTSAGFGTPKGFYVIMSGVSSGDKEDHGRFGRGASDLTNTYAMGVSVEDAVTTEDTHRSSSVASGRVIYIPDVDATVWAECDFSATITDGVRLNWVTTPGAGYYVTVVLVGGADASVVVGNAQANASATEKTVTTGIDQKIIFFDYFDSNTIENAGLNHATEAFGFAKASTTRFDASYGIYSHNAAANGDPRGGFFNNAFSGSHWADLRYQITSNDATSFGFTSIGTVHFARQIFYMAIDTDDRGLWNDAADTPTSTGDWARTGAGFTPGFVMGYMVGESTSAGVNTVGLQTSDLDGVACKSVFVSDGTNDAVHGLADQDASTTTNSSSVSSQSAVFTQYDDTQATLHTAATVGSFDSDGVTFSFSTAAAARYVNYFAIEEAFSGPVISLTAPYKPTFRPRKRH